MDFAGACSDEELERVVAEAFAQNLTQHTVVKVRLGVEFAPPATLGGA